MSRNGEIAELVRAINACWVEGRYDDLREYFHEEMVLALPGFEQRIRGAERIIDSYRDFGQQATIHGFTPREPQVDLFESAAMTTTAFVIDYELEGRRYRESGTDLLLFAESAGKWRVRWRTLIPGAPDAG